MNADIVLVIVTVTVTVSANASYLVPKVISLCDRCKSNVLDSSTTFDIVRARWGDLAEW